MSRPPRVLGGNSGKFFQKGGQFGLISKTAHWRQRGQQPPAILQQRGAADAQLVAQTQRELHDSAQKVARLEALQAQREEQEGEEGGSGNVVCVRVGLRVGLRVCFERFQFERTYEGFRPSKSKA